MRNDFRKWAAGLAALMVSLFVFVTPIVAADLAPTELTVAFLNIGNSKDLDMVQAEVNKITKAKINATVKLMPIDIANYTDQITLMITGDEPLDMMTSGDWINYNVQAAKGQLAPLADLLKAYGPDVLKNVPQNILAACYASGQLYGVPSMRDWATDYGYDMRKDLADKYKIDLSKVKSYEALTPIFKTIVEKEHIPAMLYESAGASIFSGMATAFFDPLSDWNGVLVNHAGSKVVNMYETPEYKKVVKLIRQWYLMGAIPKDIATIVTTPQAMIRSGSVAGMAVKMKPGYETKESLNVGKQIVCAHISPALQTTSSIANIMWSVPVTSKNKERAVMFMNLLYSDADLLNLIVYGIKDKHYIVLPDGRVDLPAGITNENATYNPTWGWMWGNQFLTRVLNPDPLNIWDLQKKFNDTAKKSSALGFSFDVSPVKTQYAAVQNVKNEYEKELGDGVVDPDSVLPKFVAELKAAGMDQIIAEKQKQLDAWMKTKK